MAVACLGVPRGVKESPGNPYKASSSFQAAEEGVCLIMALNLAYESEDWPADSIPL